MDDIEIRSATEAEVSTFREVVAYGFAHPPATCDDPGFDARTSLCAFAGSKLVATCRVWPMAFRFNGAPVEAAGVTALATLPHFRRRGFAGALMERALHVGRERGYPFMVLWASYAALYHRYGFGRATTAVHYQFDPRLVPLVPGPSPQGRIELHSTDDALELMRRIYDRHAAPRNLLLHREAPMWRDRILWEPEGQRVHVAVYRDGAGDPCGYVAYVIHGPQVLGRRPFPPPPNQEMVVRDLIALDADAYRALWAFLGTHDLVRSVTAGPLSEEDPAPLLVTEPRRLGATTRDGLWMRICHVEAALEGRPYGEAGELVITVASDRVFGSGSARYHLQTDGAAARARPATGVADLVVEPQGLAVLLSGWCSATDLARAGRLEAKGADVLTRADRMFRTRHRPHCPDVF